MSGIVAVLIGLGLRMGKYASKAIRQWSDIPDLLFIGVGLFVLLWAGYLTWQDKNKELIALQERLKSPEFGGNIGGVNSVITSEGIAVVFLNGVITNPVGPPSGIINWRVYLEFYDGRIIEGAIPPATGKDVRVPLKGQIDKAFIFPAAFYWPEQAGRPILPGGSCAGWIMATFGNLNWDQAWGGGVYNNFRIY
jgi:hypothetical protein